MLPIMRTLNFIFKEMKDRCWLESHLKITNVLDLTDVQASSLSPPAGPPFMITGHTFFKWCL